MTTQTILNGFAVIAKVGADTEGSIGSKSSQLTLTAETTDITTKDDASDGVLYKNEESNGTSAVLKIDGLVFDGKDNFSFDVGDTLDQCEYTVGKRKYAFTGLCVSLDYTGSVDGKANYSATINSKGKVTKSAVV